jgi:hypothetical protein
MYAEAGRAIVKFQHLSLVASDADYHLSMKQKSVELSYLPSHQSVTNNKETDREHRADNRYKKPETICLRDLIVARLVEKFRFDLLLISSDEETRVKKEESQRGVKSLPTTELVVESCFGFFFILVLDID